MFYDILERKITFLGYKTTSSKSGKVEIFAMWLSHGFGPKTAIVQTCFLGNIGQDLVQK